MGKLLGYLYPQGYNLSRSFYAGIQVQLLYSDCKTELQMLRYGEKKRKTYILKL
jgi:hypothetical protein